MDAALEELDEKGPSALSLRSLAKRTGVSHAAPAHHFQDKTGLLTAIATEGFLLFGEALARELETTDSYSELGVAYVEFAIRHRAHFSVMFRPDLLRLDDGELIAAKQKAWNVLQSGASRLAPDTSDSAAIAGWSMVHGLVTLLMSGNLPAAWAADPLETARVVTRRLG